MHRFIKSLIFICLFIISDIALAAFPAAPLVGDKWTENGTRWQWNGASWQQIDMPVIDEGDSSALITDTGSNGTITFKADNVTQCTMSSSGVSLPAILANNSILNGDFATDLSNWSGANWSWSAGTALHSAGATTALSQAAATATIGKTYKLVFDLTYAGTGSLTPSFGGISGQAYAASATGITQYITAITTTALAFTPTTGFTGSIDNVTLQEVTGVDLTIGGKITPATNGKAIRFVNTLSNPVANEEALRLDYTVNKTTSGNDTGILLNMTDSSSPGTSRLIDLQVGGTSKFNVSELGQLRAASYLALTSTAPVSISGFVGTNTGSSIQAPPATSTFSASSGTQNPFAILPTYNQSGTAAATDLLINRTQTAVGTGAQNLIDAQVSTVSKFRVDNNGTIENEGGIIYKVTRVNAATYDVLVTDYFLNVIYTDTGAVTNLRLMTTLCDAAADDGRTFVIKDGGINAGTFNITITTEGAEKIDEIDTYTINSNGGAINVTCDTLNWYVH